MSKGDRWTAARLRDAAPLFAALGDPTRLAIVVLLAGTGPESVSRLSRNVDVSRQAVSKHLQVLADAGLVRSTKHGRERIYELSTTRLADAHAYLRKIDAQWDAALDRLKDLVED
ncbi:MAG: metalloregulator ArsR/SmtB family transcription factor [Myxococcota bacterium]